nr:hypothetical protein Iba_chr06aCG5440 [Ipomoea batatas]GMD05302.1 hypothetical protein Iba_chr06bCG5270 [Ipomoea batatas]GMD06770.1 hypothetical protein Iba_chr06cCG0800 [Ipomoea batatas]GMD09161.1 hypothetical protein Iba_chr06dCG5500 [Ipomoea batatas]GMD10302.1 hypothetical protein Iba_chr06eCG4980 [Ipomoea batatas]
MLLHHQAWQIWWQIHSMLFSTLCSCFQPVLCSQRHGLKYLALQPEMLRSSLRSNKW